MLNEVNDGLSVMNGCAARHLRGAKKERSVGLEVEAKAATLIAGSVRLRSDDLG